MRLDHLDRFAGGDRPLQRLDPRVKLVGTVAFIVIVVATPLGAWRLRAVEGLALAFALGLSGLPPGVVVRRWLSFVVLIAFLAVMVALSHPEREVYGVAGVALTIMTKNALAFLAALILVGVTPFPRLLGALRSLGAPAVLVATLHFMYRYVFVLADELERMVQARRARRFRRSGALDWGLLSGLIGVLLLRAVERAERVHDAMLARGWDGIPRSLSDSP